MNQRICLSIPNLQTDIIARLTECIETGWISAEGRFVKEFEEKLARYTGSDRAVAVQSGTAGIHLGLQVLGVKADSEVIVPTLTFTAAVNPVRYLGAEPVFMDCDETLNMDLDKLQNFLEQECRVKEDVLYNKATGKPIYAMIIVHVFGNLADMDRIMKLAEKFHLKVLEDATEALGSFIDAECTRHAGTIADVGVFSFNANKIITTGGGGMVVSKHPLMLNRMKYLSTQAKDDPLFFVHNAVGYNYRMNNLQGALGTSQMDQLEHFIAVKKRNYLRYAAELNGVFGLKMLPVNEKTRPNYWFYSLLVDEAKYGMSRNELIKALDQHQVETRPIWKLIHTNLPYQSNQAYQIEKAYEFENCIINLPCSTNLSEREVDYIIEKIRCIKKVAHP